MKQTRAVAILLSAVMLSILLASAVFVAIHADHECDGAHHCLICEQISLCTHLQKTIASVAVTTLIFALVLGVFAALGQMSAPVWARDTLVTYKVKLSN